MSEIVNDGYELVAVGALAPHPRNPRRGDIAAITESIDVNGFFGAVVVQRSTGHILVGNHRYLAAQQAGVREIPVIWVDCDDETALRILLVDNRSADRAVYDEQMLVDALQEMFNGPEGLAGTGFDGKDLNELVQRLHGEDEATGSLVWGVAVELDSKEEQEALIEEMQKEGRDVRPLVHY